MHLDLPTLTFVSFLMCIGASIGFTSLMTLLKGQTVMRIWVGGLWIATLGVLLVGLRTHIPDFLSIVVGNGALVLSNVFMLNGICQHLGQSFRWHWPISFALLYTAMSAWLTYVTPDLHARVVIASLQAVLFNLAYAYLLLRYSDPTIRTSCRIAATIMLINAVFFAIRTFTPIASSAGQDLMKAGTPIAATYVIGILTGLASYFGLLQLVTERLMVDLRRAAHTDGLTGLLNRSAIVAEGRESLARCQQRGQPFALLIFDLDHFKQINDRWGHDAGDAVLRHVTSILRDLSHWPGCLASRYGGEEFVLALPGATLDQALDVAEKLRQTLALSHARIDNHFIPVTASIGVAVARAGARFEQLVRQADEAMYRTKFDGRNGVSSADMVEGESFSEAGDLRC
jgi:diguanylate cyclase (GGDEF)-like protein